MLREDTIELALREDIGNGDITTNTIVPQNAKIEVELIAKQDLILAGLDVAKQIFARFDPGVIMETAHRDGAQIRSGDIIAQVHGQARAILSTERTALNFLQHLSGIATLTSSYVRLLKPYKARLVDTRKTTPGLRSLEKYAVRCGGGLNHRGGLFGGILVKDNHIRIAGGITEALNRVRSQAPLTFKIEVETATLDEVKEALAVKADIIMLDNMDVESMQKAVKLIQGQAIVEASGQINLNNIEAVAQTGVDLISVGSITHSAKAVDISLRVSAP